MVAEAIVIEVLRQLMTVAFTFAKTNGLSEEEIEKLRKESYAEVLKRNPLDLPDV